MNWFCGQVNFKLPVFLDRLQFFSGHIRDLDVGQAKTL